MNLNKRLINILRRFYNEGEDLNIKTYCRDLTNTRSFASMSTEQVSLNKYISSTGFCSRREADKLIEQARVTINGKLVLPGARVKPGDIVEIDGERIKSSAKARPVYIALNKPVGITSTTDTKDKTNIIDFLGYPKRVFPIGRLDKDSDGLIFLTNDGDIVNKILRASNHHEKEYIVTVDKPLEPDFVTKMSNGIPILDTVTKECFVRQEGNKRFRIVLTQGLNRQIRRMCEYLGYKVVTLSRIRIMNIELGNLPQGKWRYFTPAEIDRMNDMVAESTKTDAGEIRSKKSAREKNESKGPGKGSQNAGKGNKTPDKKPGMKKNADEQPAKKQSSSKSSYKEFRKKRK